MVGDRLDTDILFGQDNGLQARAPRAAPRRASRPTRPCLRSCGNCHRPAPSSAVTTPPTPPPTPQSVLTLSGVTTEAKLLSDENKIKPDWYVDSIAQFL